ncbi:MAG: type I-U CRISPR-associated protein Cas5/Cas6, partial [Candidatus Eisenbacteria bacterium]|nr:type I-U CRISPR-associated protein Cas5/Cas6 [Candidatus Eisenbacteria bacterium]
MLAIEVSFLTGRYVATAYDDRDSAEWPPHPARLYSALAAAHFESETPSAEERSALEWLAELPPPAIRAPMAAARDSVRVFVPVNDVSVVGLGDDVFSGVKELENDRRELLQRLSTAEGSERTKLEKSLAGCEKSIAKARYKLAARVTSAIQPSASASAADRKTAGQVLPEGRLRQPRTFPSIGLVDPRATFIWPHAADAHREALDGICAKVARLGHSSSLVSVRVVPDSPEPNCVPSEFGDEILRVPLPGQLSRLEQAFAIHQATKSGRVLPTGFQPYATEPSAVPGSTPESVFSREWVILRRLHRPIPSAVRAVDLARAMHKTILSFVDGPIPEVLSGHRPDGSASAANHLAIVPIPHVGVTGADGTILGIVLVLPRDCAREDRRSLYKAVHAWLRSDNATGRLRVAGLEPIEFERVPPNKAGFQLRPDTWCSIAARGRVGARVWASASP